MQKQILDVLHSASFAQETLSLTSMALAASMKNVESWDQKPPLLVILSYCAVAFHTLISF